MSKDNHKKTPFLWSFFMIWFLYYRMRQALQDFVCWYVLDRVSCPEIRVCVSYMAPQFSQKLIVMASSARPSAHWQANMTRSQAIVISCMSHCAINVSTIRYRVARFIPGSHFFPTSSFLISEKVIRVFWPRSSTNLLRGSVTRDSGIGKVGG